MMKDLRYLLIPFRKTAKFVLAGERVVTASVRGELCVRIDSSGAQLERLGLVAPALEANEGLTGHLSLGNDGAKSQLELVLEPGRWNLNGGVTAALHYEALAELEFASEDDGGADYQFAPRESFVGILESSLRLGDEEGGRQAVTIERGSLHLAYVEQPGDLAKVRKIEVSLVGAQGYLLRPVLPGCPDSHVVLNRYLTVQPVGFVENLHDPHPTASAATLKIKVDTAREVWQQCCVELIFLPTHFVRCKKLKSSHLTGPIMRSFDHPDPGVIEIYFVDNPLYTHGGGEAFDCGSGNAKIVMSDSNQGNITLLAHELGHVLSGIHPCCPPSSGEWVATRNSVLEPTGNLKMPSPAENALQDCLAAKNDVLWCRSTFCCLDPQLQRILRCP